MFVGKATTPSGRIWLQIAFFEVLESVALILLIGLALYGANALHKDYRGR